MRLANKVSIITGAGAGMGYAAAHLFAREGSKVASRRLSTKRPAGPPPSQFARKEATPSSSSAM